MSLLKSMTKQGFTVEAGTRYDILDFFSFPLPNPEEKVTVTSRFSDVPKFRLGVRVRVRVRFRVRFRG